MTATVPDGYRYICRSARSQKILRAASMQGDYTDDMFQAIDRFLEDPGVNHLTILGDFGTGKSSCAMELTVRLLDGAVHARRCSLPCGITSMWSPCNPSSQGMAEKYGTLVFNYPVFLRCCWRKNGCC